MPSRQDFALVKTKVQKYKEDFNLQSDSSAFSYFMLNLILGLQDDEIEDAITDNNLLQEIGKIQGHDRGIDALYIDYEEDDQKPKVHFFNFKYTSKFDKTKNNFPSSEIDKIVNFISELMGLENTIKDTINLTLYAKVKEIWEIFDKVNPSFVIYLCANHYEGLEASQKTRFERAIHRNSNFEIKYYLIEDITNSIQKQSIQKVNAKIKAIDKNYFEKSDGDVRALIVNVDARDLIRIVLNDESIRNNPDQEYSELINYQIIEDAFENNVRIYLKQRSKINKNIKHTALSDETHRFFYFNNGITITCDKFQYPKTKRSPIIELENLQIVNGSQTIHALYEAFIENSSKFEDIEILCRIYETQNSFLSTQIAEYTNSQNPVKTRDVRSIDIIQQKLEQEFLTKGLYYERKRGQHSTQNKKLRIDAEKAGQVLMAFYNEMPREAKNRKKFIFGEKYDDIFTDEINADKVLLPYKLFEKIEEKKAEIKKGEFNENNFILYSSYYILYVMSKLCQKHSISLEIDNFDQIWQLYDETIKCLENIIAQEEKSQNENFSYATFFNTEKPKKIFEKYFL